MITQNNISISIDNHPLPLQKILLIEKNKDGFCSNKLKRHLSELSTTPCNYSFKTVYL